MTFFIWVVLKIKQKCTILEGTHCCHELVAAVLVGLEEVEGGTAGAEEDGVAVVSGVVGSLDGVMQIIRVDDLQGVSG